MKRSMGLLASTLLAAGLGVGGTAMAAGPAAADTGLKSVTISAENYQGYTDHYNRDYDHKYKDNDFKKKWRENCEKRDHDNYGGHNRHAGFWFHGKWIRCDSDNGRRGWH